MGVGRILSLVGSKSGFSQEVAKRFFPEEPTKLREKLFSSKTLIGKYQISKCREGLALASTPFRRP